MGSADSSGIRAKATMSPESNAYLCSISDAGEQMDIHPKDKKVVGERLALLARGHVYGETLLCDAPVAERIRRDGSRIEITFQNAEGGLKVKGGAIEALHVYPVQMSGAEKSVCKGDGVQAAADTEGGADLREEIPVTADVEEMKLVILLPEGTGEVAVKFARTRWYLVNLYNQADIPAIPFELIC